MLPIRFCAYEWQINWRKPIKKILSLAKVISKKPLSGVCMYVCDHASGHRGERIQAEFFSIDSEP